MDLGGSVVLKPTQINGAGLGTLAGQKQVDRSCGWEGTQELVTDLKDLLMK